MQNPPRLLHFARWRGVKFTDIGELLFQISPIDLIIRRVGIGEIFRNFVKRTNTKFQGRRFHSANICKALKLFRFIESDSPFYSLALRLISFPAFFRELAKLPFKWERRDLPFHWTNARLAK